MRKLMLIAVAVGGVALVSASESKAQSFGFQYGGRNGGISIGVGNPGYYYNYPSYVTPGYSQWYGGYPNYYYYYGRPSWNYGWYGNNWNYGNHNHWNHNHNNWGHNHHHR